MKRSVTLGKIERLSRALRFIFMSFFTLIPIIAVLFWVFFDEVRSFEYMNDINGVSLAGLPIPSPTPPIIKALGFAVSLIPTGIDMAVMFFLARLFGLYAKGKIFTGENVRYIKKIGVTLLIGQALSPVYQALLSAALTCQNPAGERMIRIGFSDANITSVTTALVVIVAAWIMDEGRKINEEQALTI